MMTRLRKGGRYGSWRAPQVQVLLEAIPAKPASRGRQQYCSAPLCKRASKAVNRTRWLSKPENQGYFRDTWHVARVGVWCSLPSLARHRGLLRHKSSGVHETGSTSAGLYGVVKTDEHFRDP